MMFNIILLGITSLLTDISSEMVYPILPLYLVSKLGVGPAVLGFIEGVAESLASLLKVFSGYFSDRVKSRKPFAIFGYTSSTVGKFFLYISTSWWYVLVGRAIDRLGKGIRTAPRDALIAESADARKKGAAFGLHRTLDTIGATIGVTAAYFLVRTHQGDFKEIFLLSLVPAALGVLFLFFVRDKKKETVRRDTKMVLQWSALDRRLKSFLILTFIFTLGNSSNQFLLLRAKDLGSPFATVILFYLVYNISYVVCAYPAAWISDKIGRKTLLVAGYFFYGLVYLGFALNRSISMLWLLFAVYGLYMAFTEGVEKALVVDIAPVHLRATTIGLHATLVGIGLFPASFIAGLLWKSFGAPSCFYFGSAMGIVASIGFLRVLKGL